jgi:hypothetical protein
MGNNDYYYQESNPLDDHASNLMNYDMHKDYKGEEGDFLIILVDFSKYSSKNTQKNPNKTANKFMSFDQRPEELLP